MIEIFDDTDYYKFNIHYINIKLTGTIAVHILLPYNYTDLAILDKLKLKNLQSMIVTIDGDHYTLNNGKITKLSINSSTKKHSGANEIEVMMNFTDYYTTQIAI